MLPSQGCMEDDKVLVIGGSSNAVNQVSKCRRAPPKGCELFTRDGDDNRICEDSWMSIICRCNIENDPGG